METLGNSMNVKEKELDIEEMLGEGKHNDDAEMKDKLHIDNDISYIDNKKAEITDDDYSFF